MAQAPKNATLVVLDRMRAENAKGFADVRGELDEMKATLSELDGTIKRGFDTMATAAAMNAGFVEILEAMADAKEVAKLKREVASLKKRMDAFEAAP